MDLPWLMTQIQTHADELTERVIQAVRTSPRTSFLHELYEEDLRLRFSDLYRNLGRWISEKGEGEIEGEAEVTDDLEPASQPTDAD